MLILDCRGIAALRNVGSSVDAFGTVRCTACNTHFNIFPSPMGLPCGLPFGREHFVVAYPAERWESPFWGLGGLYPTASRAPHCAVSSSRYF